jgi:hypothetical protein
MIQFSVRNQVDSLVFRGKLKGKKIAEFSVQNEMDSLVFLGKLKSKKLLSSLFLTRWIALCSKEN